MDRDFLIYTLEVSCLISSCRYSYCRTASKIKTVEAAFFDLDKTVIAKTSLIAYAPTLRKAGYLSIPMAIRTAWGHLLFKFFGADEKTLEKARKTALRLSAGLNQQAMQRLVRDNLTEVIEPIVYDDALDLLEEHRLKGHLLVLVSASPIEIVKPLAEHLGITDFIATTPVIDSEGRYTGDVEFYAAGTHKADAIIQLASEKNIDLEKSWAYSDSATDIPMLELVGNPVAVNPDRELKKHAEDENWPSMEFGRPVALGDRIPINRNWIAATVLTGLLFTFLIKMFKRFQKTT